MRGSAARKSFHFKKIPGGPNINIFCKNWHEASFYIKEQTQKYKYKYPHSTLGGKT